LGGQSLTVGLAKAALRQTPAPRQNRRPFVFNHFRYERPTFVTSHAFGPGLALLKDVSSSKIKERKESGMKTKTNVKAGATYRAPASNNYRPPAANNYRY
jgi:hypothetical protein